MVFITFLFICVSAEFFNSDLFNFLYILVLDVSGLPVLNKWNLCGTHVENYVTKIVPTFMHASSSRLYKFFTPLKLTFYAFQYRVLLFEPLLISFWSNLYMM